MVQQSLCEPVKDVRIVYRDCKDNVCADALLRSSQDLRSRREGSEDDSRVTVVSELPAPASDDILTLLQSSGKERGLV